MLCVCVYVSMSVCMCVCERETERKRESCVCKCVYTFVHKHMHVSGGVNINLYRTRNCICMKNESESHSVVSDSLQLHGLYSWWNSPGQNTGVGSSLLQGISPPEGSNPSLLYCGQILYQLSHKRSPRILEWVGYPFSRGSSQPKNWTGVSCIAGGFLRAKF